MQCLKHAASHELPLMLCVVLVVSTPLRMRCLTDLTHAVCATYSFMASGETGPLSCWIILFTPLLHHFLAWRLLTSLSLLRDGACLVPDKADALYCFLCCFCHQSRCDLVEVSSCHGLSFVVSSLAVVRRCRFVPGWIYGAESYRHARGREGRNKDL